MDWSLFFCFGLFLSRFEPGYIFHLRISCFVQLAFLVCFQGYILGLSRFALDAGVLQCFGDFLWDILRHLIPLHLVFDFGYMYMGTRI